jgi:hypothetical protein
MRKSSAAIILNDFTEGASAANSTEPHFHLDSWRHPLNIARNHFISADKNHGSF